MNTTTNLGLKMPEYSDQADIQDINDNMEILDGKMGAVGNTSVQEQIDDVVQEIGSTALPTTAQTLTGAIAEHETDLGTKADKVSSATNGHFAGLNASGNLVDSGKQASDFATPVDVEKKADAIEESNSTETEVMSFSDGADNLPMEVAVAINPVQDLHGYANPWVGGAGKNLANPSDFVGVRGATATIDGNEIRIVGDGSNTYQSARVAIETKTYSAGTYYVKFKIKGTPVLTASSKVALRTSSGTIKASTAIVSGTSEYSDTWTINDDCYLTIMTNGSTSGESYAGDITVYDLIVSTTDVPFEPYSNVCPISGWDSVQIERTGKNIFNPDSDSITWVNSSNQITTRSACKTVIIMAKEGQKYTLSNKNYFSSTNIPMIAFCDANNNVLQRYATSSTSLKSITQTAPAKTSYMIAGMYTWEDADEVQLEIGETASEYTQYIDEKRYTIAFPAEAGTVYGGTLTINKDGSGTLVVTDANIASYNGETLPSTWISDRDVYASGTTPTTGAQVVYKLASPVTYNFTAQHIRSLLGENNLLADSGNVLNVVYYADTKMYIDDQKELPAVTSDDNGKVLRVVDGVWSAVSLPSASGVSF